MTDEDTGKWQGQGRVNEPNGLISRREYEAYVAAQRELQQLRDREAAGNALHSSDNFRRIDDQFRRLDITIRENATVLAKGTEDSRAALAKGVDDARKEVERQIKDLSDRVTSTREEMAKDTSRRLALTAAFSFVLAAIPVIILISRGTP